MWIVIRLKDRDMRGVWYLICMNMLEVAVVGW